MSRISKFVGLLLLPGVFFACDSVSDFGDTNENPTQPTELDPRFLFPQVQLETPGNWALMNRANHRFAGAAIQHWASPSEFWGAGNEYNRRGGGGTENSAQRFWDGVWGNTLVDLQHAINFLQQSKENGENVDPKLGQARIWRAYIFQLVTDAHGDVPFNDAAKGTLEQTFNPTFEPQEQVYEKLFTELDGAVTQLDGAGSGFGSQDLLTYEGDVQQWKKFANSLRLRLAMRLVKRDQGWAQQEVEAALSADGGVITDNADNAMYFHQEEPGRNQNNPDSWALKNSEMGYPSQTLVEWLKDRNDPRLFVYGAVYDGQVTTEDAQVIPEDDPNNVKGMPNGYLAGQLENHSSWTENCRDEEGNLTSNTDACDIADYMQTHPELLGETDPLFHITAAQNHLLLAEAEVRWGIAPLSAEEHYEAGVRAAFKQLAEYGSDAVVSDSEIDQYLDDNPFKSGASQEEQLEQINEQYWASSYMNAIEAWNNWKRSGYPDLETAPVDIDDARGPGGGRPGNDTNGQIPRRMLYHRDEVSLNDNLDAPPGQSPNDMVTRVWWDAE
jgi:hypothetical protein